MSMSIAKCSLALTIAAVTSIFQNAPIAASPFSLTDDLDLYLPFDGDANDASGQGVSTIVKNSVEFVPGIVGQGVNFQNSGSTNSASGEFVHTRRQLPLGVSDFSVQIWAKGTNFATDSSRRDPSIFSNKDWNSGSFTGWVIARGDENENTGGGIQWNFDTSASTRIDIDLPSSVAFLEDGNWHHIVVTHDRDGDAVMYFDSSIVATRDISAHNGATIDAGRPTAIGTDGALGANWNAFLNGVVDEAAVWSRVLSASEVDVLYNGGSGRAIPEPATISHVMLASMLVGVSQTRNNSR